LREGDRTITAEINLSVPGTFIFGNTVLSHALELFFTGEKEWSGPYTCTPKLEQAAAGKK